MATQRARGRQPALAGLLAVTLAGCASASSGELADATPGSFTAETKAPALVTDERLVTTAAYGDETASYGPAPVDANPAIPAATLPEVYARVSPTSEPLGTYDVALAVLTREIWPGTEEGQLVWLIVNHHQHEIRNAPALTTAEPTAAIPPDQDTVTVIDSITGALVVQEQGELLHTDG